MSKTKHYLIQIVVSTDTNMTKAELHEHLCVELFEGLVGTDKVSFDDLGHIIEIVDDPNGSIFV